MAVIEMAIQREGNVATIEPDAAAQAHPAPRAASNPYRHIVVALDGSELAEEILPVVVPLARAFGSTVTLLRTVDPVEPPLFAGDMLGYSTSIYYKDLVTIRRRAREEVSDYLALQQDRLERQGLTVKSIAPEGPAAHSILTFAQEAGADLIALTTHGRGGLGRLVFGSVAEEVVRQATCPVLAVRARRD